MKNNALYIELKQIIIDDSYTVAQVEGATKAQIESLLNTSGLGDAFVANMKRSVAAYLRSQIDTAKMDTLQSQAVSWLTTNFPDAEFERGKRDGKPYVTIWVEGKP